MKLSRIHLTTHLGEKCDQFLKKECKNNVHKIAKNTQCLIVNVALKKNVENYLEPLKLISLALHNPHKLYILKSWTDF